MEVEALQFDRCLQPGLGYQEIRLPTQHRLAQTWPVLRLLYYLNGEMDLCLRQEGMAVHAGELPAEDPGWLPQCFASDLFDQGFVVKMRPRLDNLASSEISDSICRPPQLWKAARFCLCCCPVCLTV